MVTQIVLENILQVFPQKTHSGRIYPERPKIGYSVYNGYHVQITDYDGDDIFNSLEKHKKLYPYVSSKSRKINKL